MMPRIALLTLVLAACTLEPPFERSNPFDPGSPYPMRLVGVPDTVSAIGQRFAVSVERDPPINFSRLSVTWGAWSLKGNFARAPELQHVGDGEFVSTASMSALLSDVSIAAQFSTVAAGFSHGVEVGRNLTVGQLVKQLNLQCVPACQMLPLAVGSSLQVLSDARDANGNAVQQEIHAMRRAIVELRATGVLVSSVVPNNLGTYTFTAVGAGSTWIVIRSDHAVDSVQVTVTP